MEIGKLYNLNGQPVKLQGIYKNGNGAVQCLLPLFNKKRNEIFLNAPLLEDVDLSDLKTIDAYRESDYLNRAERNMKRLWEERDKRYVAIRAGRARRRSQIIQKNKYSGQYYLVEGPVRGEKLFRIN